MTYDKMQKLKSLGYGAYDIHWVFSYFGYGMCVCNPGSTEEKEYEKNMEIADEKLRELIENNDKEEISRIIELGRGGITMFDLI